MATRPNQRLEEKQDQVNPEPKKKGSAIPKDALRPKDHMPPKADVEETLQHPVFESDGVEYKIVANTQEVFRDVDFLEAIQVDNNVIAALRILLGLEQWNQIKIKYRDPETGKLLLSEKNEGGPIVQIFKDAMKAANAKNS